MVDETVNYDIKSKVEEIARKLGYFTFSKILTKVNAPAPEVLGSIMLLIKEGKLERKGRWFHYVDRRSE